MVDQTASEIQTIGTNEYFCDLAALTSVGDLFIDVAAVSGVDTVLQAVTDPNCSTDLLLEPNFPVGPQAPVLEDIFLELLPEPPNLTASRPLLSDIVVPDPLTLVFPQAPDLEDVVIASAPDYVFPDVPTFEDLQIPDSVTISLPEFTDELRDIPTFDDVSLIWNDMLYSSAVLTSLTNRLVGEVRDNGTGIEASVQADIWERARKRQEVVYGGLRGRIESITKSRGFKVPANTIKHFTDRAMQTLLVRRADVEREVEINIEQLKQKNFRAMMANTIKLESKQIDLYSRRQARELKAKTEALKLVIQLFNARVSLYDADAKAFAVKVEIFRTLIAAELAKLEVFKVDIERLKSLSQLNESKARLFEARIQGVNSVVSVFNSQVEAARVQAEANSARISVFKTEIGAFESKIDANAQEFEVFTSRVKAEGSKVQGFLADVSAFNSESLAYKNLVDAELKGYSLERTQAQDIPLDLLKINTEVFKTFVEAEAEKLDADTAAIAAKVDCYKAYTAALIDCDDVKVEVAAARASVAGGRSAISAKSALSTARNTVAASNIQEANVRFRGQIDGQRAAAIAGQTSFSDNTLTNTSNTTGSSTNTTRTDSFSNDNRTTSTLNKSTTDTHIFSDKV